MPHFTIELRSGDGRAATRKEQEALGANGLAAFALLELAFERGVNAVELSTDGGESWRVVDLVREVAGQFRFAGVRSAAGRKPGTLILSFELPR